MRNVIFLITLWFFFSSCCFAQEDSIRNRNLDHLNRPIRFNNKYVNFDVLKIMVGPSWGSQMPKATPSFSYSIQFLIPYCLLKEWRFFHFAYGISYANNAVSVKNAAFVFENSKLAGIKDSSEIKKSVQKTRSLGLVLMPFWQIGNLHIMTGISPQFNIGNTFKVKSDQGKMKTHHSEVLNKFSLPLLLQISYSKKNLWSYGVFFSYDTSPRFKTDIKKLHQASAGLSFGIRI